ncbi:unnamed protein product [Arctogadus glacialis]
MTVFKPQERAQHHTTASMGKVIFYEERDFLGPSVECTSECRDLLCQLNHCNSIRVECGAFMIYESLEFAGTQYFLRKGDYPDYHSWMGCNDSIRSCRLIPAQESGAFTMRLYERIEFGGQVMDLADDCPNVVERFQKNNIFSCNVKGGHWLFYEHPHYRGKMYLIRPGVYNRFSEWGGRTARVGSIRRIMDY